MIDTSHVELSDFNPKSEFQERNAQSYLIFGLFIMLLILFLTCSFILDVGHASKVPPEPCGRIADLKQSARLRCDGSQGLDW